MAFARPIVALCVLTLVACGSGAEKTPTQTGSNNEPADVGAADMAAPQDLGATEDVRLNSAPIANVRIDIAGDGSLGDEYTFSPTQVVFTPTDWDIARTITVLGVDDAMADGTQSWSLDVSVGNTIDPSYLLECGGDCPPQAVAGTTTD